MLLPMELVEREALLAELQAEAARAVRGSGRILFVGGEAGVGKTSVIGALSDRIGSGTTLLWGACDALSTPRALGPLHDMGIDSPAIAEALESGLDRYRLFPLVLEELTHRRSLVVFEDIHWADQTTLDLLRFLGRRVHRTRSLVVATYRPHDADESLQSVLGDLATSPGHRRLLVEPLTIEGVRQLVAEQPIEAEHLHRITGGNPFYVTEVLAAPGWTVPSTVTDAVLTRARRLSDEAQSVLETVSVEPGPIETSLLTEIGHSSDALDEAIGSGMLMPIGEAVTFRHELARLSLQSKLSAGRRQRLHVKILYHLERRVQVDPARLSHHARQAEDDSAVVRWSSEAARVAVMECAHREATAQFGYALAAADRLPPAQDTAGMLDLLNEYARELSIVDRDSDALAVRERLVEAAAEAGDEQRRLIAEADAALAHWGAGQGELARRRIEIAVREAGAEGSARTVAYTCAHAGALAMLARARDEAMAYCARAVSLAADRSFDDVLVRALNALGSTKICFLDESGVADLKRSVEIAAEHGWDSRQADALENIGSALGEIRSYEKARDYLHESIAFASARDLDAQFHYSTGWLARVEFEQGNWDQASELAASVPNSDISAITPIVALTVLGRIRARRGDPQSAPPLQRAWELAVETSDLQRLWPVVAGRAEQEWLSGSIDDTLRIDVQAVLDKSIELDLAWATGETGFWAWKLGLISASPPGAAGPFQLHIDGDFLGAAAAWHALGCPYEEALALAESREEASMRAGLAIFQRLGAMPMADRVRGQLRQLGASGVPTGPRVATSRHPGGLTPRQAEVLELIGQAKSDRQIAEELFISAKTVGHHVAAILSQLGVSSRAGAAARARLEGWLSEDREPSEER